MLILKIKPEKAKPEKAKPEKAKPEKAKPEKAKPKKKKSNRRQLGFEPKLCLFGEAVPQDVEVYLIFDAKLMFSFQANTFLFDFC